MTKEEIKTEKERLFEVIKEANEKLKELRKICKHEKTFMGNYEGRIGSILPAEICGYCGEVIRFFTTEFNVFTSSYTTGLGLRK